MSKALIARPLLRSTSFDQVSAPDGVTYSRRRIVTALSATLVPLAVGAGAGVAHAAKPEDVFKGKIILTASRLPTRFPSPAAMIAAIQKAKTDKIWPKEEKGNDHAVWKIEYIAFFAQPLNDNELTLKFWELAGGTQRYVAGDEQYTREKGSRLFASSIEITKPDFEQNKKYMMTLETGRRVLASTIFWLRGKGPNYSGKVEFSDDEAKGRAP